MSFFSSFLFSIVNLYSYIDIYIYVNWIKCSLITLTILRFSAFYRKNVRKAMIERTYWVISFQINLKRFSHEILGHAIFWKLDRRTLPDENDHFYLWLHLHQVWFASNVVGKVVDLTILNILGTIRAIIPLLILQEVRFLFRSAKYFACFSRFLSVKKLFQKMDCITKSNHLPTPTTPRHSSVLFWYS